MKPNRLLLVAMYLVAMPAAHAQPADPVLNEIVVDHGVPGNCNAGDTDEFIEIFGDRSADYSGFTVLEIEGDGPSTSEGRIDDVFEVGTANVAGFWRTRFLSTLENGTLTFLLVEAFTGAVGNDLDVDDDGTLDFAPWERIVDSVAFSDGGGSDSVYSSVDLGDIGGASRIPNGVDTDDAGDWVENDCEGPGLPGVSGLPGAGLAYNTPRQVNGFGDPVINEFVFNHSGTDVLEYVEIYGPPGVDFSSLTLVEVEGEGGAIGEIDDGIFSVGTTSDFGGDEQPGFWFTGFDPGGSTDIENGTLTLLLVEGFTGDSEDDLDTDDDGTLDSTPWTRIVDCIAVDDGTAGDQTYCDTVLERSFDGDSNTVGGASRVPDGTDLNEAEDWVRNDFDAVSGTSISPFAVVGYAVNTPDETNVPALYAHHIQGAGASSPYEGVRVQLGVGAVTAVVDDGFFVQTPDDSADGDISTSEGLFVFMGDADPECQDPESEPEVVYDSEQRVEGRVAEFFGLTEIGFDDVTCVDDECPPRVCTLSEGAGLPVRIAFDETRPSPDPTAPSCAIEYECYEGMRIRIENGKVTGPEQSFPGDPFAEMYIVAVSGRAFREPGVAFPGLDPPIPVWDGNPEVFEMDFDKFIDVGVAFAAGQNLSSVDGILSFEFGDYELWPEGGAFGGLLPTSAVREREPGEYTVGTLDLFELFGCEDVDVVSDGVLELPECELRIAKLAAYIVEFMDAPDILAVQQVESIEVLENLAAEIGLGTEGDGDGVDYAAYLEEGNDPTGLDIGFLVREDVFAVDALTQLGADLLFHDDGGPLHERPPLLLEATPVAGGLPISVLNVHPRVRTGIDDPVDGLRIRNKRRDQADSIAEIVQSIQDADPGGLLAVAGDFNAYQFTDGYVDVVGMIAGDFDPDESLLSRPDRVDPNLDNSITALPAEERYSGISTGSAEALDHILTSEALTPLVSGVEYARANADFAEGLLTDQSEGVTPLRASTHDGLVIFVDASDTDLDGILDNEDACLGTVFPERVPLIYLAGDRYALNGDLSFDEGVFPFAILQINPLRFVKPPPPPAVPGPDFTIEDTAGCSCGQILGAPGFGFFSLNQLRFGCAEQTMRRWSRLVH